MGPICQTFSLGEGDTLESANPSGGHGFRQKCNVEPVGGVGGWGGGGEDIELSTIAGLATAISISKLGYFGSPFVFIRRALQVVGPF